MGTTQKQLFGSFHEPEQDAVVIGESGSNFITKPAIKEMLTKLSANSEPINSYLNILGQDIKTSPFADELLMRNQMIDEDEDEDVEMEKENDDKLHSKLQIDNDFLSIIKNEIPSLKFAHIPITKDDLEMSNAEPPSQAAESTNPKSSNSFFNILGLSKRNNSQFS